MSTCPECYGCTDCVDCSSHCTCPMGVGDNPTPVPMSATSSICPNCEENPAGPERSWCPPCLLAFRKGEHCAACATANPVRVSDNPDSCDRSDAVNRPAHYTSGGIECIDAIEAALGPERASGFRVGNAFKYLWRAGLKGDRAEDLAKARWYLNREIENQGGFDDRPTPFGDNPPKSPDGDSRPTPWVTPGEDY